jgi:hypothetical protein
MPGYTQLIDGDSAYVAEQGATGVPRHQVSAAAADRGIGQFIRDAPNRGR